ncbi:MAG: hypothetical protein GF417_08520, partial [Candidatus Latescibacteria bacterium]|nr:hypothetical protein [bacterium]MBD3424465.1 hypothetical protein [Candidatus Latescibacterota bacterium]
MVLVNTPGSWAHLYPPLRHAGWHGLGGADLVFPFFLFISGSSIFFWLKKCRRSGNSDLHWKIMIRVGVIFATGLFLNIFPFREPISDIRIMGVLQRIALAWGLATVACLLMKRRGLIITSLLALSAYWLLLSALGGLSLEGNLVRAIDMKILGRSHLWKGKGVPFDPEGLLSTLPASVTVITGYLAGTVIGTGDRVFRKLLSAGLISAAAGLLWGEVYP